MRQRYRKHTLSAEREGKLDKLDFRWLGPKKGRTHSKITGRFVEDPG